ncbi:hypothetical protein FA95DRAFT_1682125 [Auriscalpium vulgare]|uniref:Uncharacterized protein n=1 Tax=Auriscalpium vulgare TaxID=40419 RepID=A0ACB8RGQ8_9AGAM|nr:hypothetical protein FA95DRAFT_1682125 [Auriscalpium vulgare]
MAGLTSYFIASHLLALPLSGQQLHPARLQGVSIAPAALRAPPPTPISFPRRRDPLFASSYGVSYGPRRGLLRTLRAPARLTNLSALLLALAALFSVTLHARRYLFAPRAYSAVPQSINATLPSTREREGLARLSHLIIVPAHGIWLGAREEEALDEGRWVLAAYQKGHDRPRSFMEHVKRGVELMVEDEHSLLVFSGGQTSPEAASNEAESYLRLASAASLFPPSSSPSPSNIPPATPPPPQNMPCPRSSNLLFSLARFRELTGCYPTSVTVVGYKFKRRRFEQQHRAAVGWPWHKWRYSGIPLSSQVEEAIARSGEVRPAMLANSPRWSGLATARCSQPGLTLRKSSPFGARASPLVRFACGEP